MKFIRNFKERIAVCSGKYIWWDFFSEEKSSRTIFPVRKFPVTIKWITSFSSEFHYQWTYVDAWAKNFVSQITKACNFRRFSNKTNKHKRACVQSGMIRLRRISAEFKVRILPPKQVPRFQRRQIRYFSVLKWFNTLRMCAATLCIISWFDRECLASKFSKLQRILRECFFYYFQRDMLSNSLEELHF